MFTARRKATVLIILAAVIVSGFALTHKSSTPPHKKTPEYASVPMSNTDYKIRDDEKDQFRSELEWAKADLKRRRAMPASELGMTEDEKTLFLKSAEDLLKQYEQKLEES